MPRHDHPGQPSKFTPERMDRFLFAIEKGSAYQLACKYAGISYKTMRKWVLRGEEEQDQEAVNFLIRFHEAEGAAVLKWLDVIEQAASIGEWQAAAWKLERRYHQYYSKRAEIIQLSEEIQYLKDKHKTSKANDTTDSEESEE